jgi:signal transduction histidine kinase
MNVKQLQHLAAAMAHEVRNPLNSMAIHVELLEGRLRRETAEGKDREKSLKSVTTLAGEIERVDRILEEYLQFAGPEDAARRPVDAAELIGEAIARARPVAEAKGVSIEVKLARDLPRWTVDADGLGEAIDALLLNALEASPRGASVMVEASADDDQAEVIVRDQGDGIAAEDLPRVFQLGFSRRGRAGIGLTVAKQIVKGHGGSIVAESKGAGQGALLRLRVPLEAES